MLMYLDQVIYLVSDNESTYSRHEKIKHKIKHMKVIYMLNKGVKISLKGTLRYSKVYKI